MKIASAPALMWASARRIASSVRPTARIGPSEDQQLIRRASVESNLDFIHHLLGGDDAAVWRAAAFFGDLLILEPDHCDTSFFVATHRVMDVEKAAIAGVAVRDQWLVHA
jgi:hypothetical protein